MRPNLTLAVLELVEMDRRKMAARSVITKIAADRAFRLPLWWRWTPYLAAAITIRRINAA